MPDTKIRAGETSGEIVEIAEYVYRNLSVREQKRVDEAVMDVKARAEMHGVRKFGVVAAFELTTKLGAWLSDKLLYERAVEVLAETEGR